MRPRPNLGDLARAYLDPLLVPLGFQSGQWSVDPIGNEGVTFCAAREVLAEHFQPLDAVAAQFPDGGGGCMDLVIEGMPAVGLARVELEGQPLSDLLLAVGQVEEAALVLRRPGESVEADLARVRRAITVLLRTSV